MIQQLTEMLQSLHVLNSSFRMLKILNLIYSCKTIIPFYLSFAKPTTMKKQSNIS